MILVSWADSVVNDNNDVSILRWARGFRLQSN
jgi:hypothetical protein